MRDAKKRLRRTMMFLNAQKPGLIKDPYIYGADSLMLDLEDAVAENQKDAARFSCFMHCARLIIMEQNGLYVLMVWTRLSGRKISAAQ